MRAMVLHKANSKLKLEDVTLAPLQSNQVRLAVEACGVCRTDLHILDGELASPKLPLMCVLHRLRIGTLVCPLRCLSEYFSVAR